MEKPTPKDGRRTTWNPDRPGEIPLASVSAEGLRGRPARPRTRGPPAVCEARTSPLGASTSRGPPRPSRGGGGLPCAAPQRGGPDPARLPPPGASGPLHRVTRRRSRASVNASPGRPSSRGTPAPATSVADRGGRPCLAGTGRGTPTPPVEVRVNGRDSAKTLDTPTPLPLTRKRRGKKPSKIL